MKELIAIVLVLLIVSSCKNAETTTDEKQPDKTVIAPTNKAGSTGGDVTQIKLTLKGGPNAGIYTASSAEPTCSMGLTGTKSFGNQYAVSGKSDAEFSSLQLIVDDYEAAKSGTTKFYIKVAFGKRLVGKSYEINGSDNSIAGKKGGSGTLTITESGDRKTAMVEGKTAEGITISATIMCSSVVTTEGIK